jgi:4-amino-4-deoxy-L-arabinose transferase-like glycosyltransferase
LNRFITLKVTDGSSQSRLFRFIGSLFVLLFLVAAFVIPRIVNLGTFVTADEPTWARRAASFYYALGEHAYPETYLTGHPGVITMWAGVAAFQLQFPHYQKVGQFTLGDTKLLQIFQKHGPPLMEYIATARMAVVVAVSISMLVGLYFARLLFGNTLAILAFLLIAFDPFYVAHSRFLHTNGMLATFMFVSILAFQYYLRTRSNFGLLTSGIAAGLSFICISPGFLLIPIVSLITLGSMWDVEHRRFYLRVKIISQKVILPLLIWGTIAFLAIYAIWPAMWANPIGTMLKTVRYGMRAAEGEIGGAQLIDAYQITDKNSDYLYFYPLTYVWRSTPISLIGIGLALMFLIFRRQWIQPQVRRNLYDLSIFVIIYTVIMSLGIKKFDRYYLPVYLPLDIFAAAGWLAVAGWLGERFPLLRTKFLHHGGLALIVGIQLASTVQNVPYYLTYYNPLLGGLIKAPQVMIVGWGEGLNEAAIYLRQQENICNKQILSWYPLAFTWYSTAFGCEAQLVEFHPDMTLEDYLVYDYVVIYINQIQRNYPEELLAYLFTLQPQHSVWIKGVEYARIYELSNH